jgi:PAS domain S-box-containing protein
MTHASEKTRTETSGDGLRYSAQWFATIFEGSRDAIFITNIKGFFADVNKAATELTGYPKQELLTMSIPDLAEPMDLKEYHKYSDRILAGEDITSEILLKRKDNSYIHVEIRNKRIEVGNNIFIHIIARDITARKIAETELKNTQHFLSQILNSSPYLIYIYDIEEHRNIYTNKAVFEFLGYTNDQVIEMGPLLFEKILHPEEIGRASCRERV